MSTSPGPWKLTRDEAARLLGAKSYLDIVDRAVRQTAEGLASLACGHVKSAALHFASSTAYVGVVTALRVFPETREPPPWLLTSGIEERRRG